LLRFVAFAPCITGEVDTEVPFKVVICLFSSEVRTRTSTDLFHNIPLKKDILKRTADKVTNGDWEDRWPLLTQVVT